MSYLKRYWVSWWSSYGDVSSPFTAWTTGYDGEGRASYCAVIDAPSEMDARIEARRYFSDADFRFSNERPADWTPGDRFSE